MKLKVYYIILFALLCYSTQAQYRSVTLKKAQSLEYNQKYFEAMDAYELALEENPSLYKERYRLTQLYVRFNHLSAAETHYKILLSEKHEEYPKLQLEYAQALKLMGNYEAAIKEITQFLKTYKGSDKNSLSKALKLELEACSEAQSAVLDSSFALRSLNEINSLYTDLSPVVLNDQLVFVTIPTDSALTYTEELGQEQFLGVYVTDFDTKEDTAIGKIARFGHPSWYGGRSQIASIAFSADGNRAYFAKCTKTIQNENRCKLFAANKENEKWGPAKALPSPINSEDESYSTTHPSVAKHKKKNKEVLYFSSNKSGGMGGYDLYSVDIDFNLKAGKPKNLGRKINSEGDEISPFFDQENKSLTFASNGRSGFGGYDLYLVKAKGRRFGSPTLMGKPFNSSADDFFLQRYEEEKYLLVSNRTGAKKYYKDFVLDDIFVLSKGNKKYIQVLAFINDSIITPMDTAQIAVKVNSEAKLLASGSVFEAEIGSKYFFNTKLQNYINASSELTVQETSPDTSVIQLVVEPVVEEKEIRLNNIYFAFSSAELNDTSKTEIDSLHQILQDNPQFRIEIGAHTDNKGRAKYNLKLSQERAQSVVNYLLSKGVDSTRLVAKGYGMGKPIAPNTLPDGSDNPEGRQMNRRIVFKIIGLIPDTTSGTVSYKLKNDQLDSLAATTAETDSIQLVTPEDSPSTISQALNEVFKPSDSDSTSTKGKKSLEQTNQKIEKEIQELDSVVKQIQSKKKLEPDSVDLGVEKKQIDIKTDSIPHFISSPIDASVTKGRFRWLRKGAAQKLILEDSITLHQVRIIAKEKTGVKLKVRVVKAKNGKTVAESEIFTLEKNKAATGKAFQLMDLKLDLILPPGKYFIYPVVEQGEIGHLGNFTKENVLANGKILVGGVMFNNQVTEKGKYKFKLKEEKGGRLKNYGPFFRFDISLLD